MKYLNDIVRAIMALVVTLAYIIMLVLILSGKATIQDSQISVLLFGSLSTVFGTVFGYWFGTTAGSAKKTDIIAQSQPVDLRND